MESKLIVMKFGGSSVSNKERIFSVSKKIKEKVMEGNKIVVVVSAQGDTTDNLLELSKEINENPNLRELDVLLSAGEQISISLLSMALGSIGVKSISLTGWQAGIQTCNCYGNSKIVNIFTDRIEKELQSNDVIVVAGFQGININEDITTMGRGGSDTSAVALAAALKTKKCKIYTDVDGVYTADPRIVEKSKKIDEISYDEMINLADNGAQVLHNRSVRLAKKYGIEISVLSSMKNSDEGTKVKELDFSANPISSVAIDENLFALNLNSKCFNFAIDKIRNEKISIADIFFSVDYSLLLLNMSNIEAILRILPENCDYKIDTNVSKITVIPSNYDNMLENFSQFKDIIDYSKIKYIYVCKNICFVLDKTFGREFLNKIHDCLKMD